MANSVSTTTASLSERSDTNHVSYALQYRKAGTASWQSASPTTDTTQTLTQLEAGTVYEAYVLANCSSGSVPCLSITFSTASFWQENDYGDFYTGSSSARVGIGTTAPVTQLHVKGGLLLEGSTGTVPISGAGTRLMWVPTQSAFRAGVVTGTEWDTIGTASVAMGKNSKATGSNSMAIGEATEATGANSMALGSYVSASGENSVAIGTGGRDSSNNAVMGKNDEPNSVAILVNGFLATRYTVTEPPLQNGGSNPGGGEGNPGGGGENGTNGIPCETFRQANKQETWLSQYVYGDFILGKSGANAECGGKLCAEMSLWGRHFVRSSRDLGYMSECDGAESYNFRRTLDNLTWGRPDRVQFLIPYAEVDHTNGTYETGSKQSRQFPDNTNHNALMQWIENHRSSNGATRTNNFGVPEVTIGHDFPLSNGEAWRLRIDAANTWGGPGNPRRSILTNGSILIQREGGSFSHNYGVSLTGNQQACDETNCFTVTNGSATTFNIRGDGRLVTQGEIGCKELQVAVNPFAIAWPDYVFCADYKLPPLSEVKSYVQTNGHLPNIPSADVVATEGIKVGEMNAKLLEKVEQLFLYVIELEEKVKALEAANNATNR